MAQASLDGARGQLSGAAAYSRCRQLPFATGIYLEFHRDMPAPWAHWVVTARYAPASRHRLNFLCSAAAVQADLGFAVYA